jgi:hypothetical protein
MVAPLSLTNEKSRRIRSSRCRVPGYGANRIPDHRQMLEQMAETWRSSPESGNRPKDSELASCRWLGFHVLVTTGKLAVRVEGLPLPGMAAPTFSIRHLLNWHW